MPRFVNVYFRFTSYFFVIDHIVELIEDKYQLVNRIEYIIYYFYGCISSFVIFSLACNINSCIMYYTLGKYLCDVHEKVQRSGDG